MGKPKTEKLVLKWPPMSLADHTANIEGQLKAFAHPGGRETFLLYLLGRLRRSDEYRKFKKREKRFYKKAKSRLDIGPRTDRDFK